MKLKLIVISLISAIMLAVSPVSYASGISVKESSKKQPTSSITVSAETKAIDEPIITPLDVQLISPFRYNSTNAYENSFTLSPANGTDTNIWLNNVSTTTLYMKIYKNGVFQLEVTYNPGTQKTVQIYQTVSSDYRIYVYNKVGASNIFDISARQF